MASSSSSNWSDQGLSFAILNGEVDETAATVVASLRVGDNSIRPNGLPEFRLLRASGPKSGAGPMSADGHLTWDGAYADAPHGDFDATAAVRFVVRAPQLAWSVGTVDAVTCPAPEYRKLAKVCVVAAATRRLAHAELRWDVLHLRLTNARGQVGEHRTLPCLPRARSRVETRRGGPGPADAPTFQSQFAEIVLPPATVGLELKGRVSLYSRGATGSPHVIDADDLHAKVLLFTE